jgi:hypothetical protein
MTPADSNQAIVRMGDSQLEKGMMSAPTGTTTTTQHLAVLYQTHHHVHPILTSPMRRPSRLPDTSRFLMQQQMASTQKEIKA